jgi:hypothetical protein
MKRDSKEFYDLMNQFEKDVKEMPFYTTRNFNKEKSNSPSVFYGNGETNKLFIAYMTGYQYAKCKARLNDLKLEE